VKIRISEDVLKKIAAQTPERNITPLEVEQCFMNVEHGYCEDTRAQHLTNPLTKWFVADTDRGRTLKIMFVPGPDGVDLKSAYEATEEICRIYKKYAKA
jgi:hypothetical protein